MWSVTFGDPDVTQKKERNGGNTGGDADRVESRSVHLRRSEPSRFIYRTTFRVEGGRSWPSCPDSITYEILGRRRIETTATTGNAVSDCTKEEITGEGKERTGDGTEIRSSRDEWRDTERISSAPAVQKKMLWSHYQEKGATDMYQLLSSGSQEGGETPQDFLVRLLVLNYSKHPHIRTHDFGGQAVCD